VSPDVSPELSPASESGSDAFRFAIRGRQTRIGPGVDPGTRSASRATRPVASTAAGAFLGQLWLDTHLHPWMPVSGDIVPARERVPILAQMCPSAGQILLSWRGTRRRAVGCLALRRAN
jgi:hypothetical protein